MAHPRAWLLTIMHNAHLNAARRQQPQLAADLAELEQGRPAFGMAPAGSPEDSVVGGVFEDGVERAVLSLDPRFRRVLLLIDVDQLTYAEVGAWRLCVAGRHQDVILRCCQRATVAWGAEWPPLSDDVTDPDQFGSCVA